MINSQLNLLRENICQKDKELHDLKIELSNAKEDLNNKNNRESRLRRDFEECEASLKRQTDEKCVCFSYDFSSYFEACTTKLHN